MKQIIIKVSLLQVVTKEVEIMKGGEVGEGFAT